MIVSCFGSGIVASCVNVDVRRCDVARPEELQIEDRLFVCNLIVANGGFPVVVPVDGDKISCRVAYHWVFDGSG